MYLFVYISMKIFMLVGQKHANALIAFSLAYMDVDDTRRMSLRLEFDENLYKRIHVWCDFFITTAIGIDVDRSAAVVARRNQKFIIKSISMFHI